MGMGRKLACTRGHPLGVFAFAGPTRPVGTSDATTFDAIRNLLPFRSDVLTSFVWRLVFFPGRKCKVSKIAGLQRFQNFRARDVKEVAWGIRETSSFRKKTYYVWMLASSGLTRPRAEFA